MYPLYVISGISGSGKTTLGRSIAGEVAGASSVFVDQDHFYVANKPSVTLSNGATVKNWDHCDALNPQMADMVGDMLARTPIVLVGFSLTRKMLKHLKPEVHIHLVTARNPHMLSERCKQARMQSKPRIDAALDALVVDEVVIPFYQKTVRDSSITHLVDVYDDTGNRKPIDVLRGEVLRIMGTSDIRARTHYMEVSEPYHTLIGTGRKPVEGRKISETWRKVRPGDTLVLGCGVSEEQSSSAPNGYGLGHVFSTRVTGVRLYLPCFGDPLGRYLEEETLARTLPDAQSIEEGRDTYLQWSSQSDIDRLGMMGIELEVLR